MDDFDLVFDLPCHDEVFATRLNAPISLASIRRSNEDFQVIEHLGLGLEGSGEHVYLNLTKTGTNTSWVAQQIADYSGVAIRDVGYGGRKDRHAVTRQWFSVYLPRHEPNWSDLTIENVYIHQTVRHRCKLRRGKFEANEFRLVLHFADDIDHVDIEQRLYEISSNGFPNYFGRQRFGRQLHNLERADKLLRLGRYQGGDRGMLISAARSWLFNYYLSKRLERGILEGFGPLYGKSRDAQPGEDQLGPVYSAWVEGLRRLGVKTGERPLLVFPEKLSWQFGKQQLKLNFRLPPGSYATSLLNELFVVRDEAL